MTEVAAGRVNIALTGPAEIAKDAVTRRFPFTEGMQVMRLGLAYAIRQQIAPVRGPDFGRAGDGQNANVGSLDRSGEIRALLQALYANADDPYVVAETLMSLGLVQLAADLEAGTVSQLTDITYQR